MKAAAWPPAEPTLRSVTAGREVLASALEYSVATVVASVDGVTSAAPWNCIVSAVMPAPGDDAVLTLM